MRRTDVPAGLELLDERPQGAARGRIEAGRRLVEEHQLRVVHQGQGNGQPLALPAGQVLRLGLASLGQPQRLDQLGCRPRLRVEAAEQVDQLGDGQLRIEGRRLEADPDPRLERVGVPRHVEAEHADLATVGLAKALEDLDGRRLAGAIRAEQPEDLTGADLEAHAVDGVDVAVVLLQVGDADDGIGRHRGIRHAPMVANGRGARTAVRPAPARPHRGRSTSRCRARSTCPPRPRIGRWRPEADVCLHRGLQADVAAGHLRQDPLLLEHVAVGLQRIAQRTDRRHQLGEGRFEHVLEPPVRGLRVGQPAVLVVLDPAAVLLEVVQQSRAWPSSATRPVSRSSLRTWKRRLATATRRRAIAAGAGSSSISSTANPRSFSARTWPGSRADRQAGSGSQRDLVPQRGVPRPDRLGCFDGVLHALGTSLQRGQVGQPATFSTRMSRS